MSRALKGLNRRNEDTAAGECYLTPRWSVDWLLERWQPIGEVICDPCACGFGGWSIGGMIADHFGRARELSDIDPQGPGVIRAGFRGTTLPPVRGGRTIGTNAPYNLMPEFVRWALEHAEEVVVLTRFGFLCAENGRRAKNLVAYLQPAKRLAFELLPGEGLRRLAHNASLDLDVARGTLSAKEAARLRLDVHEDARTLTGYRMSSTGVDHGWAVYRRGHVGDARLVIEAVDKEPAGQSDDCPQLVLL